ncbi:agmatine deiminase family protein [Kitasatospora sp. NPDC002040]|uniref:agmatine deiminase family protein n=1 Tax=Kitasatospora sp. NPDC002040 TaxID=3154661 RepID=UPI003319EE30
MNEHVERQGPTGRSHARPIDRRSILAIAGATTVGVVWAANSGTSQVAHAEVTAGCSPSPTPSPTPTGGTGTYSVPVDTVQHTRTWMAWPDSTAIWGSGGGRGTSLANVQANIALIANTIAKYEPVTVCANSASVTKAKSMCTHPNITVIGTIPVDDCWMRDSGPVFRTNGAGGLDAIGLNFNGWGKRQTSTKDGQVAAKVAAYLGVPFTAAGITGEGGAIETDGAGTLMATRSSLLEPNRNPGMTEAQATAAMCAAYGASKVIWFNGYVDSGDITRDHVDATSRFLAQGKGLVQQPNAKDPHDGWYNDAINQYNVLSTSVDAKGTTVQVTKLGGPDYNVIRSTDQNFVGSYANFYVCNGAVISAQFGDSRADAAAKATLAGLFPGRVIEQLNIDAIGAGGGGIHCVTQPQPVP